MQLASSGSWLSIGRQASASIRNLPPARRGIHIGSAAAGARNPQPSSTTQRLLRQTRGLLQAFVGHLTAPGTLGRPASAPSAAGRSLHALARGQTIQGGLSLPARHALAQAPRAPRLPRAPAVPTSVFQVGLGTARTFTTGRPIFAHLAENVPVACRALVEADWDVRMREEKMKMIMKRGEKENKKASKAAAEKIAIRSVESAAAPGDSAIEPEATAKSDLEHYFPVSGVSAEPTPDVTTTLLIPLAPSPSSRLPLAKNPPENSHHPLIPFAEMSSLHYDYTRHKDRVAALFARLDAASVWDHGARCDVYGDARGGANVLRVSFDGWDAKRVRAAIGETGSGWCVLEEHWTGLDTDDDDLSEIVDELTHSPPWSELRNATADGVPDEYMNISPRSDPAQSLLLPTLDFSSAFSDTNAVAASARSAPPPDNVICLDWDEGYDGDTFSDGSAGSSWANSPSLHASLMSSPPPPPLAALPPLSSAASSGWLAFSSAFEERMEDGPLERLF